MKARAEKKHVFIIAVICIFMVLLTSCSNTSQAESTNKESELENVEQSLETTDKLNDDILEIAQKIGSEVEINIVNAYEGQVGGFRLEIEIVNNSPYTLWSYKEILRKADGSEEELIDFFTLLPGDKYKFTNVCFNTQKAEEFDDCRTVTRNLGFIGDDNIKYNANFNLMTNQVTVQEMSNDIVFD